MRGADSQENHTPTILMVVNTLRGGGAERQIAQMANFWASRGVCVVVATFTAESTANDFYDLDPAVRRFHLNVALGFGRVGACVFSLRKVVRKIRPDVILSFSEAANVVAWITSLGLRVPCCLGIRSDPETIVRELHWTWRISVLLAYRFCRSLVVQTRAAADWVQIRRRKKVIIIPNPLRSIEVREVKRSPLILAVGSLTRHKGHDVLVRAFAHIQAEFPGWQLVILGEGPERSALEALCRELNVESCVKLLGQVHDVESWLGRSEIFVMSSRLEGFPNALIEAMSMGLPVVSTRCPHGPAEIICSGKNGLLVPVDDYTALGEAIRGLILDPERRRALGDAAMEIRDTLDEKRVMRMWETVLFDHPLNIQPTV